MPTNRKRQMRNPKPMTEDSVLRFLKTGEVEVEDLIVFLLQKNDEELEAVWKSLRDEILTAWIKEHPCTRPWAWWTLEAPKEQVDGWDDVKFNSAQRKRLGGIGTPFHEVSCSWGGFCRGIPESWVDEFFKKEGFDGIVIDPDDPPQFESEAAYLDRHGVLTVEEKKYLAKHSELLEPEVVLE